MNIIHFSDRVRRIGWLLPRYEVLVMERPWTGFGHTEVVWGYTRAWRRAWVD